MAGLSYESSFLGNPNYFSPQNQELVALFRRISSQGTLRIGGNSQEFTDWNPELVSMGQTDSRRTTISQDAIDNLAQFLEATGWSATYGLNLGTGIAEHAAEEASYVSKALGQKLIALQIGNEPDGYIGSTLRPQGYGFKNYLQEWTTFADAIQRKTPGASLAGPDVGSYSNWIPQFVEAARYRVVLFTGHFYPEGPAGSSDATMDHLLRHNGQLDYYLTAVSKIVADTGIPFSMTETNSCFRGGQPGVSDAFGSSLWGANYTLQLAQAGITGVNFHSGKRGIYPPIADNPLVGFSAHPLFYGMMLAHEFDGTSLLQTKIQAGGANVTAYAAQSKEGMRIAVFNLDTISSHTVALSTGTRAASAKIWPLKAPSLDSKKGVTLGGAEVGPGASWSPVDTPFHASSPGEFQLDMAPGSAVLLFV